ncbi:MAG TPA: GAF domain-containing protein, partial [Gemmatimonadales bacterium]|nr:GAF domain-containing protein [Gemmatimonadales bacterium]
MIQPSLARPARGPTPAPAPDHLALATLLEVSDALAAVATLSAGLHRVLGVLAEPFGSIRSTITLIDPSTGQLYIEASAGISADGRRARYRMGEGITGQVVEHGKPLVVPHVSREPLFLFRAAPRRE